MPSILLVDPGLVVLIGAAGSGKSTFAARHFAPDEILSSDAFRTAISGDAADQSVSRAAFAALDRALARRLAVRRMTVVDATNLSTSSRRSYVARASRAGIATTAVLLALEPDLVLARNRSRASRVVPEDVVRRQADRVRRILDRDELVADGFASVVIVREPEEVEALTIERRSA